jgi:eukaryotic-like serine/threonine-protein kinase
VGDARVSSQPQFQRISEIFHAATAVPAGSDREALLRSQCGSDLATLEELRSLLEAHEAEEAANAAANAENVSLRFGPYQTVRVLGRGGMGVVYLAHRADGLYKQNVAIKTLNNSYGDSQFEQRFHAERRILASLNHPNITSLLDGGTERGEPYLVMEYVEGEPLDRFCDARQLSIRERIELLLHVCAAVSYAHRNLVLHRDLKPSNILVTGDGVPHLLDFGVAKLLSDASDVTRVELLPVSARYASPERLRGSATSVAADQFSLGVVLYELLTGAWPYGKVQTAIGALERIVRETPLVPPSDAVTAEAAMARGTTPTALARMLRGDLTAIVAKALETDPDRRYASVDAFAADLQAYLDGRPVVARHQTAGYRLGRFLGRHWLIASAVTAVILMLAAALVVTVQAQRNAERRFAEVRSLAKYLLTELDDQLASLPASTKARASNAETSMAYLDRLRQQAGNDAALKLEIADGYLRLGNVWGNLHRSNLGQPERARIAFERGLELAQQVVKTRPGDREARRLVARINLDRAMTESLARVDGEELRRAQAAIDELSQLHSAAPTAASHFELGRALTVLGLIKQQKGGLILALGVSAEDYERARKHLESAIAMEPQNHEYRLNLADLHERIAIANGTTDPARALSEHARAFAIFEELPPTERATMPRRLWRAKAQLNYAWALGQSARHAEAFAQLAAAQPTLEQLSASDPENMRLRYDLTGLYRTWGIIANYAAKKREAIEKFTAAIRIYDAMPTLTDPLRFLRAELAMRVAALHTDLAEPEAAARRAREAAEMLRPLADRRSASVSQLQTMARLLSGEIAPGLKNSAEAIAYAQRAIDVSPKDPVSREVLADCYWRAGNREEARKALQAALDLTPVPAPGQPPSRSRSGLLEKLRKY